MKTLTEIYEEIIIEQELGDAKHLPIDYELDYDEYQSNHIFKINKDETGTTTLSGLLNYLKMYGVKLYSLIKQADIQKLKMGHQLVFDLHGLDIKIKKA